MDDDDEAVIASSCLIFGAFIFIYLFIYISNVIGCRASLTEKVGRVVSCRVVLQFPLQRHDTTVAN